QSAEDVEVFQSQPRHRPFHRGKFRFSRVHSRKPRPHHTSARERSEEESGPECAVGRRRHTHQTGPGPSEGKEISHSCVGGVRARWARNTHRRSEKVHGICAGGVSVSCASTVTLHRSVRPSRAARRKKRYPKLAMPLSNGYRTGVTSRL